MYSQIEIDPRRCNGKPVVAGTRIPVTVILDQLAESGSVETALIKYPELRRESITAALRYCHSMIDRKSGNVERAGDQRHEHRNHQT